MKTYESKLRKVEAIQWTGENKAEVKAFINGKIKFIFGRNGSLTLYPKPAEFLLFDRDYLIKDSEGGIFGMDEDDFERFFKEI